MQATGLDIPIDSATTEVEEAFNRLRKTSIALRSEGYQQREVRLKSLRKWIFENRNAICQAVYDDFSKPEFEADLSEVFVAIADLNQAIRKLKNWAKPRKVSAGISFFGTSSFVHYEPKGVCLIISPWNYPFNLAVGPLISAIAAGNTVVLKPSENTPHTSALLKRMVSEVFPPSEVVVFEGGAEISQSLLKLPFNHIFFTGSTAVGKLVMEAAARNLASVTLELGGKSPVVVDETADLEDAAEKIAWGKLLNCGQTCVSPDYVLVHESVQDRFLELLKNQMISLFDPDKKGFINSAIYARIVNNKHHDRLTALLNEAIEKGGHLYFGSNSDRHTNFIAPAILKDVPDDAAVMREEIFGPILPVNSFKQHSEVISYINQRPKPLSLYVFSKDRKIHERYRTETSSGSACVNDVVLQFQHPHLPFGGVNDSGMGKSHGFYGFLAFSNEKAWLKQRIGFTAAKMLYPPYTSLKKKILNLLMKYV